MKQGAFRANGAIVAAAAAASYLIGKFRQSAVVSPIQHSTPIHGQIDRRTERIFFERVPLAHNLVIALERGSLASGGVTYIKEG